jgi:hypothetical protein
MSAELVVQAAVTPFIEEVEVVSAQWRFVGGQQFHGASLEGCGLVSPKPRARVACPSLALGLTLKSLVSRPYVSVTSPR